MGCYVALATSSMLPCEATSRAGMPVEPRLQDMGKSDSRLGRLNSNRIGNNRSNHWRGQSKNRSSSAVVIGIGLGERGEQEEQEYAEMLHDLTPG